MNRIAKCKPYGSQLIVEKTECSNHVLRNYSKRLRDLVKKKSIPPNIRKVLNENLKRLRVAIAGAINYRSNMTGTPTNERILALRSDILNGPSHVFGDHTKCDKYFCDKLTENENNHVPNMILCGVWDDLKSAVNIVAHYAPSLIENVTNNLAELFNSYVAKLIGGKRVNYALKGSYEGRCEAASLSFNTKHNVHSVVHTKLTGKSPGTFTKAFAKHKENEHLRSKRKLLFSGVKKTTKKRKISNPDEDYGNMSTLEEEPDMPESVLKESKEKFLMSLQVDTNQIQDLQKRTVLQAQSQLWKTERAKRLTASWFGRVCKMRKNTSCKNIVSEMLYSTFGGSVATRYGIEKEPFALSALEVLEEVEVQKCGLFVDIEYPFLAASPDGLIGDNGTVEVKCPLVAATMTPEEAVANKKVNFCVMREGKLVLKEQHGYHYQIQGQLHITKREYCFFVFWTPKGISVQKIERSDSFWKTYMESQLVGFYMNCLLSELVDPRYTRGLPIRERLQQMDDKDRNE